MMETINSHDKKLADQKLSTIKTNHHDLEQQLQQKLQPPPPPIVYGELSVLGYNGSIPHHDKTPSSSSSRRNKSKYLLCKRPEPNGIRKSRHYIVKQQPQATKAIQDKDLHSISYTFSRSQTIIVEYHQDEKTDMFQIGRSSESPIDFIVTDTVTANSESRSSNHHLHHSHNNHSKHQNSSYNNHNENTSNSNNGNASYHSQMYSDSISNGHSELACLSAYQRNIAKMRQTVDNIPSFHQASHYNHHNHNDSHQNIASYEDFRSRYHTRQNQAPLPPVLLNSYAPPPSTNPGNLSCFLVSGEQYRDNHPPMVSSSGLNNASSTHNIPSHHNHHHQHIQAHSSTGTTSNNNNYYQAQLQPRPDNIHNSNNGHHFNANNHDHSNNISTSGHSHQNRQSGNCKRSHATQSTISRFACRILVDRNPPYTARIFAAGFDSSKNIFLGEKATKWEQDDWIDGLTTNGVLLMHPKEEFTSNKQPIHKGLESGLDELATSINSSVEKKEDCSNIQNQSARDVDGGEQNNSRKDNSTMINMDTSPFQETSDNTSHFIETSNARDTDTNDSNNNTKNVADKTSTGGIWREVSVDGGIYAIRESRSAAQKGKRIDNEDNILKDGTLIDLCGATLLWRSLDGFKAAPTKKSLEEKVDKLNASRPQCPVGLNTLVIPRKAILSLNQNYHHHHHKSGHHPYVYTKCGHVQGYHDWGATDKLNHRTCPICMTVGTVARLTIGIEPSFYVDSGQLTHSFNPCGHMASERTAKYWSSIKIPYGTHFFHSICPFCATPLATTELPTTKLIFQLDIE